VTFVGYQEWGTVAPVNCCMPTASWKWY